MKDSGPLWNASTRTTGPLRRQKDPNQSSPSQACRYGNRQSLHLMNDSFICCRENRRQWMSRKNSDLEGLRLFRQAPYPPSVISTAIEHVVYFARATPIRAACFLCTDWRRLRAHPRWPAMTSRNHGPCRPAGPRVLPPVLAAPLRRRDPPPGPCSPLSTPFRRFHPEAIQERFKLKVLWPRGGNPTQHRVATNWSSFALPR